MSLRLVPIRGYCHYQGICNDYLVEVPWYVIEQAERADVTAELPEHDEITSAAINERFRDLGCQVG